jgi:DNA-binding NtrC family response regulator
MEKGIVVLDADIKQCSKLCAILEERYYQITPMYSLPDLESSLREPGKGYSVVIIDLDTLPVDMNLFRRLKRIKPTLNIIGLSSRPFHPELEEAMTRYIYACLSKPVDEDELDFWIKSLFRI